MNSSLSLRSAAPDACLLICDADRALRLRLGRMLQRAGYATQSSAMPRDCVDLVARAPGRHRVLILGQLRERAEMTALLTALGAAGFSGEILLLTETGTWTPESPELDCAVHAVLPRKATSTMIRRIIDPQQRSWSGRRDQPQGSA